MNTLRISAGNDENSYSTSLVVNNSGLLIKISGGNDENSSSTALVVNNRDLLIKILLCLPVKFVLVVKSVSKHWYSLISSSYFMQKHCVLHNNKLSISGLFYLRHAPTDEQDIPTYGALLLDKAKISTSVVSFPVQVNEQPGGGLYIQQSCNGLLLCRRPGHLTGTLYIYNPSTRNYRMIPPPPPFQNENMNLSSSCYWHFYLAFSPHKSLSYEVVFLWRTGYDITHYKHQMAVYSSETGSWRLCGDVELDFKLLSYHCVSWNGFLNWIDGRTLYYFNINQQVLKTSQLTDELMQKYWHGPEYFEECVGHMYLILPEKGRLSNFLGVFEMEIDYKGWKPICRVDLGGLTNRFGNADVSCYRILKVAHVQGDGDEDELKALIHLPGKIISYDLRIKSFKEICGCQMGQFVQYSAPAYIRSLANV